MLGSIGPANTWQWGAWGKHPVARDYFDLGQDPPLMRAFCHWVEKGLEILTTTGTLASNPCSWRFWAKGPKREVLLCGVGRDSSDSVGRPHPLLIMGMGALDGWENQWDLLPLACEKTWAQMEYLCATRLTTLKELEDGIRVIRPPHAQWSELFSQRKSLQEASDNKRLPGEPEDPEEMLSSLSQNADLFIRLETGPSDDPHALTVLWHAWLKGHLGEVPNTVFVGGTSHEAYLALFMRALTPADFIEMWSVSSDSVEWG